MWRPVLLVVVLPGFFVGLDLLGRSPVLMVIVALTLPFIALKLLVAC